MTSSDFPTIGTLEMFCMLYCGCIGVYTYFQILMIREMLLLVDTVLWYSANVC